MARPRSSGPTDRELSILRVLWEGARTVRDVHEALQERGVKVGYTSVQKTMQIMFDKGLVVRDERRGTHIYEAAEAQRDTQESMTKDFMDKVFGGSASRLVARALSVTPASPEELDKIEALLLELRGEQDDT